MKFYLDVGPVHCTIGSSYNYEIGKEDAKKITKAAFGWFFSLSEKERASVKAIDVFPEFVRHGGTFATRYITFQVTCTAGKLEKMPEGMTVPEGGEKGWELCFHHRCLSDGNLGQHLELFPEAASRELATAHHALKI